MCGSIQTYMEKAGSSVPPGVPRLLWDNNWSSALPGVPWLLWDNNWSSTLPGVPRLLWDNNWSSALPGVSCTGTTIGPLLFLVFLALAQQPRIDGGLLAPQSWTVISDLLLSKTK